MSRGYCVCLTWTIWRILFCLQGTTVYPLLASVLIDETEWEHPHTFYPAHFLDKDGKFIKRDAFLPFSAGWLMQPSDHSVCWDMRLNPPLLQVAGLVLERVWPEWNSSSSWPPSSSTSSSLLHQEFPRMSSMWLHHRALITARPPTDSAHFLVCKAINLNAYLMFGVVAGQHKIFCRMKSTATFFSWITDHVWLHHRWPRFSSFVGWHHYFWNKVCHVLLLQN